MRFSDAELALLKATFADNEELINAVRKVFLEDELTDTEVKLLETIRKNKAVQAVLTRQYAPELKVDAPIGQVQDRLMIMNMENLTPDMATYQADAKERVIACINSHLEELFTGKPGASFKSLYKLDLDNPVETYVGLMARNLYVMECERLTHHIFLLAGRNDETPDQTVKRLQKDSTK